MDARLAGGGQQDEQQVDLLFAAGQRDACGRTCEHQERARQAWQARVRHGDAIAEVGADQAFALGDRRCQHCRFEWQFIGFHRAEGELDRLLDRLALDVEQHAARGDDVAEIDRGIGGELVFHGADDLLDDVLHRDETGPGAVLAGDQGDVDAAALHLGQQLFKGGVFAGTDEGAGQDDDVGHRALGGQQQILDVDDAERLAVGIDQRVARQAGGAHGGQVLAPRHIGAQRLDVATDAHRVAHLQLAEVEDVFHEQQTTEGHHPGRMRAREDDAQFVLAVLVVIM